MGITQFALILFLSYVHRVKGIILVLSTQLASKHAHTDFHLFNSFWKGCDSAVTAFFSFFKKNPIQFCVLFFKSQKFGTQKIFEDRTFFDLLGTQV